jgi:hypothetical protein
LKTRLIAESGEDKKTDRVDSKVLAELLGKDWMLSLPHLLLLLLLLLLRICQMRRSLLFSSLRERWLGEEEKSLSRKRKNEVSKFRVKIHERLPCCCLQLHEEERR